MPPSVLLGRAVGKSEPQLTFCLALIPTVGQTAWECQAARPGCETGPCLRLTTSHKSTILLRPRTLPYFVAAQNPVNAPHCNTVCVRHAPKPVEKQDPPRRTKRRQQPDQTVSTRKPDHLASGGDVSGVLSFVQLALAKEQV